ncbi:hypothetical protein HanLR1_Chr02g0070801 [Helianthus annuus]|nr:hypothetical protein HanLR1_Chr02g0070801 [Helianthus annuus]
MGENCRYADRIANAKWEVKELGMEHNGYVDLLLGEFKHYKTRLAHGGIRQEFLSWRLITFFSSQTMALIAAFSATDKTAHNSHKFGFTLSPTNYGYWKAMIQPFLVTNNLIGYVDGTIPCPPEFITPAASSDKDATKSSPQANPNHPIWIANDAHVRMLLLSTISEASFQHVQGTSSRDLWISLADAYAPHTSSREYILKTQLLKIQMKGDETSSAYLTRAREYVSALANIGEPMKEKDIVMLVISGLRDEYNGLKSNLLGRQYPTAFSELPGLLADHDYMIQKAVPTVPPVQAFTTATNSAPTATTTDLSQTLQQLIAQLNLQPQPATPQAFYTNRGRGRGQGNRRGRGNFNRPRGSGNRSQFSWASNQNTVYGHRHHLRGFLTRALLIMLHQTFLALTVLNLTTARTIFVLAMDKLTRLTLLTGPSKDGLYSFCLPQTQPVPKVSFSTARASSTIWHQRLGHPHPQLL